MLVVDGYIGGRLTHMLIDTGSDVSIVRQDIWEAIRRDDCPLHCIPGTPVVAANGEQLQVLGQAKLTMQVGGVKDDFTCLVASALTQECIIGADFLVKHHCIIDLQQKTLLVGGQSTPFRDRDVEPHVKSVCHVFFSETTVLPGESEVELPLSLSDSSDQGTALFAPTLAFVEKHGVLIAHSLTLTGTEKTRVRILNPSSAPVTIYQNEKQESSGDWLMWCQSHCAQFN